MMLYGASYYAEYQPVRRVEEDLRLMVEAGFTVIRLGESTWASYEPEEGEISFEALAEVVDRAYELGLAVVLGTPSYAVPPWLSRRYPEVMATTAGGSTLPYGARQNLDFTNPVYRRHVERIVRAMAERFGAHPGVIAWQVDNEIGVHELAGPALVDRFRQWVLDHVGTVEEINARWGLDYWSHRLTTIDDLWAPVGNTNPGYALEWGRFQESLTVEFVSWQRDLLRSILPEGVPVVHDVVAGDSLAATGPRAISEALDHTATNIYFPMQDALALPDPDPSLTQGLGPWWLLDRTASTMAWRADTAYSLRGPRGSSFWVTEAQAGTIGEHATNAPPYPGQLKLVAHSLLARGADLLAYWHWHTLHYGAETYWQGVLGHDLEPGRIFAEVSDIGAELRRLEPVVAGLVPDADVAVLASRDSLRALQFLPPLQIPGTDRPDPHSYHRILMRCYDAALGAGAQVRIVHPDSDWSGQSVLVVPALYIADDALLERLVAHARSGAHVIVTFRTGYADEWSRVRATRAPGVLREAVGASYQEFTTLTRPVPLSGGHPVTDESSTGEGWADVLTTEGAEVVAGYEHPFLERAAAITSNEVGAGRMTWVGTLPDAGTMTRLIGWALAERDVTPAAAVWQDVPESVRVSSATTPAGSTLWFVANHSWEGVEVAAPDLAGRSVTDAVTGRGLGGSLTLAAWESRVLVSAPGSP
ncbi:beta-galactosidase [Herbiconiux sp. KACC 21604]|uniref:beta-galactosidase n=1 Tax=unclassified Herbiconiux TaxID=2618217 RepID=UPI001491C5C4|nr:beta-galactosidase [Herbiconiux sp. SALV-R1]QJU55227.1 beta-galactosidase [Herbiconiux sp. SALV-R1]WPO86392.1 beta-galactosidase [Herbiconiux sp. KACC 21604]